ncbi:hypothetical protein Tco_0062295, partial [Tanacetum coccineum]
MPVDDLFQLVPKLLTKIDSLETELNPTTLTMGKALVKLVKKVKKMEDVLKRRHVVLPDSEDEDADISSKQGRNLQEEGLDEMVRNMIKDKSEVFKTPTQSKTSGEEDINPTTLEAAKTMSKVASQRIKKLSFEEIKKEFDKLVKQVESFIPINIEATKAQLKRYGEELKTKISKKQRIDVSDTEVKGGKIKEEESVIRTEKRKKQKARKGINVNKSPQGDSETDEEESVEAMNPTPLDTK